MIRDPLLGYYEWPKDEIRCTEETAMKVQEMHPLSPSWNPPFGAVLGIPVVVSEGVPEGKMQFWRDGEMLLELDVEG
jgi:hypothetical protein